VIEGKKSLREFQYGLDVPLHVQPRARKSEVVGFHNGAVKLKIAAPPVDDAANRAVVDYFSTTLAIPKAQLRIVSGAKSREKVLRVEKISISEFLSHFPSLR